MKLPIDWINYIKSNEDDALERIYLLHKEEFVHWLLKKGNVSWQEALDIFQVTVLILYENVRAEKVVNPCNIRSYLYGIGKNKLYEHYRYKKKKRALCSSMGCLEIVETTFELKPKQDQLKLMYESIDKLGDPCKTLLTNFYFNRWSMDRIALEMNYKNGNTVKTKKFKCLQRLKRLMAVEVPG